MRPLLFLSILTLVACDAVTEPKVVQLDPIVDPNAPAPAAPATPVTDGAASPAPATGIPVGMPVAPQGDAFVLVDPTKIEVTTDVLTRSGDPRASRVAECEEHFGSPIGRYWYTFADDTCHQGTSVSLFQLLHNGSDGLGCTLRWFGIVTTKYAEGFAGAGVNVDREDLAQKRRLLMEVRGDGRSYRAQFVFKSQLDEEAKQTDCGKGTDPTDYYGQEFVCGDGTGAWREVTLDLTALKQFGYGTQIPLDLSQAERFQVVTRLHAEHGFQCEFRIIAVD